MNCPKCKNPIEDNSTACEWCGYGEDIEKKKDSKNCPKCKNSIEDNISVCKWCGYEIKKPEEKNNDCNIELKEALKCFMNLRI
ncbi:MAG: zinc ribbon domain-containing protein [Prevotellaceae bacterium]|jgi:predicted Zn-ribbon and HTH transcriptional regulator|nr:zinc ribbon domain-containing protein [Prevotellaceae bacterium]